AAPHGGEVRVSDRLATARPRGLSFVVDSPRWLGPLMIGPAVLYIVLVVGLPFVLAILYALSAVSMGHRTLELVVFLNLASVLGTPKFQTALKNTFVFAVTSQLLVMVLATVLALALIRDFHGKWLVRLLILDRKSVV